ncbi:MAG: DUF5110 domain-containing protein [Flavobacterium sp. JAD_PAG50586_2]|nr:MAG: DUF5110 domain-containing protein [Flavobacterium sp. JAD_PAG50586_2]
MIETIQNTTSYSLEKFNLHYYFDAAVTTSSGKLYNDDGKTPNAFEKGQSEMLNFTSTNNGKSLIIKMASTTGKNYTATDKNVSVLIHNIKAKRVFVNGQEQLYKRMAEPLQVFVKMTKETTQEVKIEY